MKSGLIVYSEIDYLRNIWFIDKCINELAKKNVSLIYMEEKMVLNYLSERSVDFVIYRARDWMILKQIQDQGIVCFNNYLVNQTANSKILTYAFLKENEIPCLASYLKLSAIKKFPCIMKKDNGHGGKEVHLISSKQEADDILLKYQDTYVYQEYYKNTGDIRLYVLNKQVVTAIKRSNATDFRSNYSLGGDIVAFNPNKEMKDIAIKIANLLDADYVGVDFLETENGYLVNEIEDPVGSRMVYQISDLDIINLFINCICQKLKI